MASGEDWLMRPVTEHLCSYESLKNGSLNLLDLTKMNEALDVKHRNSATLSKGN